jgi:hypothetical protein
MPSVHEATRMSLETGRGVAHNCSTDARQLTSEPMIGQAVWCGHDALSWSAAMVVAMASQRCLCRHQLASREGLCPLNCACITGMYTVSAFRCSTLKTCQPSMSLSFVQPPSQPSGSVCGHPFLASPSLQPYTHPPYGTAN